MSTDDKDVRSLKTYRSRAQKGVASRSTTSSPTCRHTSTYTCRAERCGPAPASIPACRACRCSPSPASPSATRTAIPSRSPATTWLDRNRAVVQMTWCPGFPMLIEDRMVVDGGWIERADVTIFNHYRPPRIGLGDASKASPWLEHLHRIYPDDAEHSLNWLAHRVQRPHEKINHALVLGGAQGSERTLCSSR